MPGVIQHDARKSLVLAAGVPIDGFAPGSFLTIEPGSDKYTLQKGAGGLNVRSKSSDKSATITLRLQPGSTGAFILSGYQLATDLGLPDIFPLVISVTGMKYVATEAWLSRAPRQEVGQESTPLEYQITANELTRVPIPSV